MNNHSYLKIIVHFVLFIFLLSIQSCSTSGTTPTLTDSIANIEYNRKGKSAFINISAKDRASDTIKRFDIIDVGVENSKLLYHSDPGTYKYLPNTVSVEDVDQNGSDEVYFAILDLNSNSPRVLAIAVVDEKLIMTIGKREMNQSVLHSAKYFVKSIDKKFSDLPDVIQRKVEQEYEKAILMSKDYSVFELKKQEQQRENIKYEKFKENFPNIGPTVKVLEEDLADMELDRIHPKLTHDFICFVPGGLFDCIIKSEMSLPTADVDLRSSFRYYGKIEKQNYDLLFYQLDDISKKMFIASYSKSGEFLSRVQFAGINSDTQERNGTFQDDIVYILQLEYEYGKKGDQEAIVDKNVGTYTFDENGFMLRDGEKVKDIIR